VRKDAVLSAYDAAAVEELTKTAEPARAFGEPSGDLDLLVDALQVSRDPLRVVLHGIADGITVQDASARLVYANPVAARMLGYSSVERLLAVSIDEVRARFILYDEDGRSLPIEELPGRRALAGHEDERVIGFRSPESEAVRWATIKATPVVDEGGRVQFAVNIFRDVTDLRRRDAERTLLLARAEEAQRAAEEARRAAEQAQRRAAFLYRATSALDENPLVRSSRLDRLAEVAVPDLCDFCAVYLEGADQSVRLAALAHVDHAQAPRARARLIAVGPEPLGVSRVMRTGEPELVAQLAPLEGGERQPFGEMGARSYMVVPLSVRGRACGAIAFVSVAPDRRYDRDDLAVANELGDRASRALETAWLYEESQRAVAARDEVLAFVSHDLRNPLSAISMATELLQRLLGKAASQERRAVDNIFRSVERMEHLIGDLLDLARLEAGRLSMELRNYDVRTLVADATDLLAPLAASKSVSLAGEAPAMPVFCDRERILQVLSNLIGNAIKFTPEGGQITVRASAASADVQLEVADTGVGIAAEQLPHIFNRYWQATRHDRRGLGLGLAIAEGIVVAHNGRIWVESQLGQGSRFYFTLPARAPGSTA
jgi:PAS domain S-box-containing protein